MKLLTTLLASLALAGLSLPQARASDGPPAPCAGVFATDAKGDNIIGPVLGAFPLTGTAATKQGPENMDIRKVWFNTVGGKTTGFIQLENLTKEISSDVVSGVISYTIDFDYSADNSHTTYVEAVNNDGQISYVVGYYQDLGPEEGGAPNVTRMATTGQFIEGPGGVVAIDMPPDMFKVGAKLETAYAWTSTRRQGEPTFINDQAPDDGAEKTHTITECPPPPPPPPVAAAQVESPPPPPAAADPAPAAAQSQPAGQPASTPAAKEQAAQKKAAKKASCKQKAKKLKGKKRAKALKKCKKAKKKQKKKR